MLTNSNVYYEKGSNYFKFSAESLEFTGPHVGALGSKV